MYINYVYYFSAPSSVRNLELTLIDNTMVVRWSPPIIPYGEILQYTVQRVTSSGKSYYYVSGDQNSLALSHSGNAVVSVAAVNQYGQSSFELAKSTGMKIYVNSFVLIFSSCIHSSMSSIPLY